MPISRAIAAGIGENEPTQRKKKWKSYRVRLPPVGLHAEMTPKHERTKSVRRFDTRRFALEATVQVLDYEYEPDVTKPKEVGTSDGSQGEVYGNGVECAPPAEAVPLLT